MNVDWNNVLVQLPWWIVGSLVLLVILRGLFKEARRFLVRIALFLIVLAILLSLIPNIKFGGPGNDGGPGGGAGKNDGGSGNGETSGKKASLVVRVNQLPSKTYEVRLEPDGKPSQSPVAMKNSPEFRRKLVRLLGEVRQSDGPRPTPVRLVFPPSMSSHQVAYRVLEDILISGQCVIVSRDR